MIVREACEKCMVLDGANPATKVKMMSYGILKSFRKDELIFREREEVNQLYFLVEGCVALYKTNRNQDRKVIFIYGCGEMLNEVVLQMSVTTLSCAALTDIKILSFSKGQFLEMMESDFELTKLVVGSLSQKLRRNYHQLGNTANSMHLDRQMASKLWKLGRDFGKNSNGMIKIDFELTITFLADMMGSKRETISRIVKKFTEEGLIRTERKYFYIRDMDALKEYVTRQG